MLPTKSFTFFGCLFKITFYTLITGEQLKELAQHRLDESRLLYPGGYYQGAYYMAGYAVEFALKALICKRLGVEVFVKGHGFGQVSDALHTHHLPTLLVFAGLFPNLQDEKIANKNLFQDWSKVSEWTEQRRYEPLTCSQQTVINFINAVERIMQWILKHY